MGAQCQLDHFGLALDDPLDVPDNGPERGGERRTTGRVGQRHAERTGIEIATGRRR